MLCPSLLECVAFVGVGVLQHHGIVIMLRLDIVLVGGVELAEQFGEDIAHSVEKVFLWRA